MKTLHNHQLRIINRLNLKQLMGVKWYLVGIMVFVCLFASCYQSNYYQHTYSFQNETWNLDTIVKFDIQNTDTKVVKDIFFEITNTASYPVANLRLFVNVESPSGVQLTDTVEFFLATREGMWRGKRVGEAWKVKLPYKQYVKFGEKGTYKVSVVHGLRSANIEGIKQLSLITQLSAVSIREMNE